MRRSWRWVALLAAMVVLCGCNYSRGVLILSESQQYYFIPAGTPFNAVVIKGQPPIQVVRDKPTWAVDAGYLFELQKAANRRALEIPE